MQMCAWLLIKATAQRLRAEQRKPASPLPPPPRRPRTLTASCSVPGCSVDGAVFLGKVLGVADPLADIGHPAMGGRVGEGQPAEDVVIWCGGGLSGHPLGARFVVREGHHQLASLEVTTQHKGDLFHPGDQGSRLHCNLTWRREGGEENVLHAICSCSVKQLMLRAYSLPWYGCQHACPCSPVWEFDHTRVLWNVEQTCDAELVMEVPVE